MNILETKNLTKYYGKSRGMLDVSMSIKQGEIFRPTSGSASIFGMDCVTRSDEIKADIGYVPAEVNYYDDMKVKDLLAYSAKFYKKDCISRLKELCSIFEVETNKRIDSLSFGNKKKVAIVQALLHQPGLLVLDEPTGGLDPLMQNKFFDVLHEEKSRGTTIFFSSHILSEVEKMCDRVAIIKEGKILKIESIEKLHANKYKKLKLEHAADERFDDLELSGVTSLSTKSRFTEFLFSGNINEVIRKLAQRKLENLWIEELSLEEIFLNYYEKEEK